MSLFTGDTELDELHSHISSREGLLTGELGAMVLRPGHKVSTEKKVVLGPREERLCAIQKIGGVPLLQAQAPGSLGRKEGKGRREEGRGSYHRVRTRHRRHVRSSHSEQPFFIPFSSVIQTLGLL